MGFQQFVNSELALGVPGRLATGNPHATVPQALEAAQVAGAGGVYAGRFGWIQPDGTVLNTDGGSGKTPDGIIINENSGSLYDRTEASLLVQEGRPVTLLMRGDIFVATQAGAADIPRGAAVCADPATGEIVETGAATQFVMSVGTVDGVGVASA